MKVLMSLLVSFLSICLYSQNIGINKANPNYPLDVNGNVNVDGKILVNSAAGKAGEVLTTNSSGGTSWASLGNFKYAVNMTSNATFTIPADVTRIAIEVWGAGGGGAAGGGGGGGMYTVSFQDVSPGALLTISIGNGGARAVSAASSAGAGGATSVSGAPLTINALGGNGATSSSPGFGPSFGSFGDKYVQYTGQAGEPSTFSYAQKNSTTFVIIRKYGDGGASGPDYNRRCPGQTISYNENTSAQIEANFTNSAPLPGGGGGGGISSSQDGAKGMVVIRY